MVKAIILGALKQFFVLSKDRMNIKAETVSETMTALRSEKKKKPILLFGIAFLETSDYLSMVKISERCRIGHHTKLWRLN